MLNRLEPIGKVRSRCFTAVYTRIARRYHTARIHGDETYGRSGSDGRIGEVTSYRKLLLAVVDSVN